MNRLFALPITLLCLTGCTHADWREAAGAVVEGALTSVVASASGDKARERCRRDAPHDAAPDYCSLANRSRREQALRQSLSSERRRAARAETREFQARFDAAMSPDAEPAAGGACQSVVMRCYAPPEPVVGRRLPLDRP